MTEHKNIVTRWAEVKAGIYAELARLEAIGDKIAEDVKAACGQRIGIVEVDGPCSGGSQGVFCYCKGVRAALHWKISGRHHREYQTEFPKDTHWDCGISQAESWHEFLKGLTGRQLREAAEATL